LAAGDTSAQGLAGYRRALADSFVLKDMRTLRRFPHFMEDTTRLFTTYPKMVGAAMRQLYLVDGQPVAPLRKALMPIIKQVGLRKLATDAWKGVRAL
jgi:electron transfer flavoprotein-quinone oxidoreductase